MAEILLAGCKASISKAKWYSKYKSAKAPNKVSLYSELNVASQERNMLTGTKILIDRIFVYNNPRKDVQDGKMYFYGYSFGVSLRHYIL